jgi:hypothetical protein
MAKITQADLDAANESEDPISTLAARKEGGVREGENANIDAGTRARAMASVAKSSAAKAPTVSKAALEESGLSLRDYLNKQQGLTRRGSSGSGTSKVTGGSNRGGRGGPSADELETYSKGANQRAWDKANEEAASPAGRAAREKWAESQAIENVYPEELLIGGGALKLGKALLGGAKAAAKTGSRALAKSAPEELEFLGRSGARNITPAKRIGMDSAPRVANNPTPRLPAPTTAAARRQMLLEEEAIPTAGRESVTNPMSWMAGPKNAADFKKGGKVKPKAYAAGGSVKGWGQARGARSAKIV